MMRRRTVGSHGDWLEFDPDEVERAIYEIAGVDDLAQSQEFTQQAALAFESERSDVLSVFAEELAHTKDSFLESIKGQVEKLSLLSEIEVAHQLVPRGAGWSRDSLAVTQGFRLPPHFRVLSEVWAMQHTAETVEKLSDMARKAGSHLSRQRRQRRRTETVGTNVFIGHGRSHIWRELKDFIEDRLNLPADEFNRVAVAGVTPVGDGANTWYQASAARIASGFPRREMYISLWRSGTPASTSRNTAMSLARNHSSAPGSPNLERYDDFSA